MENVPPVGIPSSIAAVLDRLVRRRRAVLLARGGAATCAVALGSLLGVMAVDAGITLFAAWPRWVLSLVAYAATGAAAWFTVARPLRRSFTLTGAARLIEQSHPELQERISSAVELLASADAPELRGSAALIAALAASAARDASAVQPRREITLRPLVPALAAAAAFVLALGALFLLWPRQAGFLLARAAAPFLNLPNVRAVELAVTPGDATVPRGSHLDVVVVTSNRLIEAAELRVAGKDGREQPLRMAPDFVAGAGARRFVYAIAGIERDIRYRIRAGDALTRYYDLRVAVPPAATRIDLAYAFPPYTQRPAREERDVRGDIRALAGTVVTVAARLNRAVTTAELALRDGAGVRRIAGQLRRDGDAWWCDWRLTLRPPVDGTWWLRLADAAGLTNAPAERVVQTVRDAPPVARMGGLPAAEIRARRTDRIAVRYAAEDDIGLGGVALHAAPSGAAAVERSLFAPEAGRAPPRAAKGTFTIDLSDAAWRTAPRLTFWTVATDSLPADWQGPQTGVSERCTIVVDDAGPSWSEQRATAREREAQEGVERARRELEAARREIPGLRGQLGQEKVFTVAANKQVDKMEDQLRNAETALRDVARDLERGAYDALGRKLAAIADKPVREAADHTVQIRTAMPAAARQKELQKAAEHIEDALKDVAQQAEAMREAAAARRRAQTLEEAAGRQTDLASARETMERNPSAAAEPPVPAEAAAPMDEQQAQAAQAEVAQAVARLARETSSSQQAVAAALRREAARAKETAQALAAAQSNLLSRTAATPAEAPRAPAEARPEELQRLHREQARLAKEVERLAQTAQQLGRPETGDAGRGAQAAEQAANALHGRDLARATERAAEAARALDRTTAGLRQGVIEDLRKAEASKAEHTARLAGAADEAARLGSEQAALRREMEALASGTAAARLAAEQRELAERTGELNARVQAVRGAADGAGLAPPAAPQAAQAAASAERARARTADAAGRLDETRQGRAPATRATPAQAEAVQQLSQTAQALAALEATLASAAGGWQEHPLGDAYAQVERAKSSRRAGDAVRAAARLRDVARKASEKARELGVDPDASDEGSGRQGEEGDWAMPGRAGDVAANDWLRLSGALTNDVGESGGVDGPEEYRGLIRRYFDEVNRRGGE